MEFPFNDSLSAFSQTERLERSGAAKPEWVSSSGSNVLSPPFSSCSARTYRIQFLPASVCQPHQQHTLRHQQCQQGPSQRPAPTPAPLSPATSPPALAHTAAEAWARSAVLPAVLGTQVQLTSSSEPGELTERPVLHCTKAPHSGPSHFHFHL